MSPRAKILFTSTAAYVLGFTLIILAHETAHAVATIAQGATAIQSPFSVASDPPLSTQGQVITAMAGPLFSLVAGLVLILFRPFRGRDFADLVWCWAAFLCAEEGFGYFTIAGIISAGDTARAFELSQAPGWIYAASTVFGIAGLFLLAFRFAPVAKSFAVDIGEQRAVAVWSWLLGTAAVTLLTVLYVALTAGVDSSDAVAVIVGASSLGVFAPMSMMFARRYPFASGPARLSRVPVAGSAALVVVVLINLLLTRGLHWG